MVGTLTSDQQQKILVELLQDRGGVELARSMLQRAESGHQEPPDEGPSAPQADPPGQDNLNWCRCGKCRPLENPVERIFCKIPTCVTTTETFHDVVLNRHVLSVCIIDRRDYMQEDAAYEPSDYRKAAYRQYSLYSHGYLGRGNRKTIPSCVVWRVRDQYPAPDNNYLGFRPF